LGAKRIDGKAIALRIKTQVAEEVAALRKRGHVPCLAAILIGDDSAAASYARSQTVEAQRLGVDYRPLSLPAETDMAAVCRTIADLNADPTVSGIMLQLPVPQHLDAFALQQRIDAEKDVEGVNATNLGLLAMGRDALVPCTAAAAYACLQSSGIEIAGREAVVLGRSLIVGKPLAMLLLAAHATVTQCHTRTRDLASHTRRAEILCVAAGVPAFIGGEHVSPGAVVIDVGSHCTIVTDQDGRETTRTIGDVRFDEVAEKAAAITPVPGGVGPVTVAMLLANTVAACKKAIGQN
jgi:methylenetetrahydrofolate dehydrogenase (NADP+)/methenyltetrahydrofolate cyclohydrolase